jgi:hypothetical protein
MPRSSAPVVHTCRERGAGGFANLTLASGERILISIAVNGVRVHRVILWGRIPGRTLHVAGAAHLAQAVKVIGRDIDRLPQLPDSAAMDALLTSAIATLNDAQLRRGAVDGDGRPLSALTVLTRAALAAPDAAAFVRTLSRAAATP